MRRAEFMPEENNLNVAGSSSADSIKPAPPSSNGLSKGYRQNVILGGFVASQ